LRRDPMEKKFRLTLVKSFFRTITFLLGIISGIQLSAPQSVISIKTEEVRIDMLVTEKNQPIEGLKASDFEVRDNGALQKITYVSFEQMPIGAVLVLDMSGSVAGEKLRNLKNAGSELLDGLKKEDRAGLITFSHRLKLESPILPDIEKVKKTLSIAQSSLLGESSLIDASYAGMALAESKRERPLVIIFTDGVDTSSSLTEEAVLDTARRGNAVIYAVTTRRIMNKSFLFALSRLTGGNLLEVDSTDDLGKAFLSILEEFRRRYLLTFSPSKSSQGGWHPLEIRVKNRDATIQARTGYFAEPAKGKER
jgi:VWFA-related protein